MIDRIRYTSVLCYTLISKINFAFCIQSNILKQSITSDRIIDIRLRLFIQVDNFCIASTFKVEYTVIIPAVLIITDQKTFRICGKCSFTCSGKSEENCCILTVHICVCRTVHGSNAL